MYIHTYMLSLRNFMQGGGSQSPRPAPFGRLLWHTENTLALFLFACHHREDRLCRSNSAIQTRLGTSSLLEERSRTLFCCFHYVVGCPPNWGKRPRYIEIEAYIHSYCVYITVFTHTHTHTHIYYIYVYAHIYCYEAFELLPGMTTLFRDLQEAYPWCL